MGSLSQLQQAFHNFLKGDSQEIESFVVGKNTKEIKRRLGVYHEAYRLRLMENLRGQYPILAAFLKENFEKLAQQYRESYPPKDFAIRQYGRHMAAFLSEHQEYPPFLAELAQFEWGMNVALDESADKPLLTIEELQQLSEEQLLGLRFCFHPSLQLFTFNYDVPTYWKGSKQKSRAAIPEKLTQPLHYTVWRKNLLPYFRSINHKEYVMYNAVMEGADFTGLCEAILPYSSEETAAQEVVTILLQWLTDGWCCKV